jgi:hypothetical protein
MAKKINNGGNGENGEKRNSGAISYFNGYLSAWHRPSWREMKIWPAQLAAKTRRRSAKTSAKNKANGEISISAKISGMASASLAAKS